MSRKLIGIISIFVLAGVLSGVCYANPISNQITFGPSSGGTVTTGITTESFSGVWGWAYQGANSGNPGFTLANATISVVGGGGGIYTLATNGENFTIQIGVDSLTGILSLDTLALPSQNLAVFIGTLSITSSTAGFRSIGYPTGAVVNADFVTYNGNLSSGQIIPSVPEPSSLALLGTGILGLAGVIRRKFQE
jgi:PEP-CTERM motif